MIDIIILVLLVTQSFGFGFYAGRYNARHIYRMHREVHRENQKLQRTIDMYSAYFHEQEQ